MHGDDVARREARRRSRADHLHRANTGAWAPVRGDAASEAPRTRWGLYAGTPDSPTLRALGRRGSFFRGTNEVPEQRHATRAARAERPTRPAPPPALTVERGPSVNSRVPPYRANSGAERDGGARGAGHRRRRRAGGRGGARRQVTGSLPGRVPERGGGEKIALVVTRAGYKAHDGDARREARGAVHLDRAGGGARAKPTPAKPSAPQGAPAVGDFQDPFLKK